LLPPLDSLLETLKLLLEQSRAYERILPADNYPARAAVAVLGDLARKALNEAKTLAESASSSAEGQPAAGQPPFTPRELEVLRLAAHGLTNKEIAYRLTISERTIQFHMNSIFNKSATSTRTEAVALALREGWVS
jgi:two-component system, NarL family, response regulator LiaR